MAIIEEFVLKIKAKTEDLIRGGNEVERQKKKFTDDQKRRDKEEEKRRRKELDHNKQVKRDLLDRIKHTKDLALKITGLAGIFSAIGMAKLTDDTIKQADALQFLSKETGIAATRLKALQDANRLGGGTAEGMTEAVRQAANDMAMLRQGRGWSEIQGGMLLAKYGNDAKIDWNDAISGDPEKFLLAKMRVVDWIQKQKKENLGGIDPRQMASQLAIEAGMGGVLNANQDFAQFQKDLAARSRVAGLASGQEDTARKAQRELTQIQLQFEDLTKTIVMQAVAPEITKIGKAIGSLSERDKQRAVETIQKLIQGIEELAKDFYKLSQDKDTKEFFSEVGGAVKTTANFIDDTVKSTVGWKTAIEGLIGLRLLAFFAGLAGAIGLGAGVGVTGAILAAAGAVALLAGSFDKIKSSDFVKEIEKFSISGWAKKTFGEDSLTAKIISQAVENHKFLTKSLTDILSENSDSVEAAKYAHGEIVSNVTALHEYGFDKNKVDLVAELRKRGKEYGYDADAILKTYQESGLDPNVLLAQAYQESKFNPKEVSPKGAVGFAQFLPDTAKQFGLTSVQMRDAEESAKAQVRYMQYLKKRFGSMNTALAAYNWGEGNVSKYGIGKLPGETTDYLNKIIQSAGSQDSLLTRSNALFIPSDLRIKSKEALAGGKTKQAVINAAKLLQDLIPDYKELTGADDLWHQKNKPKSKHTQGTAFDFTIGGGKELASEITRQTREVLKAAGIQARVIDEYNNPSGKATGGHIHVELLGENDLKPRAPVIPVDYTGTEQKKSLPKPMVVDKGQYNQNTLSTNKPIVPAPLPTPLPAPLPPPGATTHNQSVVNNVTMNNTFNTKSTDPVANTNEIKNALDFFANFSNPVVNAFDTSFPE